MPNMNREKRILAIDLRARSFGFVVLEGPNYALDWGVRSFREGVNAVRIPARTKVAGLMNDYAPHTVVLKHRTISRNAKRAKLQRAILREAEERRIPVRFLSSRIVKSAFAEDDRNKYTIASALAQQLRELAPKLPPVRKIWKSEDYRMSIFDAAALGVAYFKRGNRSPRCAETARDDLAA